MPHPSIPRVRILTLSLSPQPVGARYIVPSSPPPLYGHGTAVPICPGRVARTPLGSFLCRQSIRKHKLFRRRQLTTDPSVCEGGSWGRLSAFGQALLSSAPPPKAPRILVSAFFFASPWSVPGRDDSPARAVGDFPKGESETPALAGETLPPSRFGNSAPRGLSVSMPAPLSLRRQTTYQIPLDKS